MLRKMLSILIAMVMLLSMSATFVSANDSSGEESFTPPPYEEPEESVKGSTFDEAYVYLSDVLESKRGINSDYFTEESFADFYDVMNEAHFAYINAYDDMFTAEDLLQLAEKLINAYNNLEGLIYGDVNGDMLMNIRDATKIQKYLVGLVTLSTGRLLCADLNRDNTANIKDATYIRKCAAGLITTIDNRFLYHELYVIELKTELIELMTESEEAIKGKELESSSYYAYLDAYSKAGTVCGDEFAKADEVKAATKALEDAIKGLVDADDIPVVPYDVDFNLYYAFRVGTYEYDWEPVNVIVNSRDELIALMDKFDVYTGTKDYWFPDEYDDAFFEENVLVVSALVLGGSGCSQEVKSLTVDGDTLTIYRTIYRPTIYPPDMYSECAYIEVNRSDVQSVTNIVNETKYVTIVDSEYWY